MTHPYLEVRGVGKSFPGVRALSGVSLHVRAGEVLALVGENGAGKSTLMKILAGVQPPDAGDILIDGRPVRFAGVNDSQAQGISLIHQELNLAENLDVVGNLFLGRETLRRGPLGWFGLLDRPAMTRAAGDLLARVGLPRGLATTRVEHLSPGQKQLVEVARALSMSVRVLIMDEPTSSLTQTETDKLFEVVAALKAQGVAVIYISHRLAEVKHLADRATVLRDGRNAGELVRGQIDHDTLVRLMVGRDLKSLYPRQFAAAPGQVRLQVRDLTYPGGAATPVSFELRAGEVVGVAGLIGAGRTELAETLFGLRRPLGGDVLLDGKPVRFGSPAEAVAGGLLLVPEDRRQHGVITQQDIRTNLALPNLDELSVGQLVVPARVTALSKDVSARLRVRASSDRQLVGQLSGGNQQKVVVGKWLHRKPKVMIFDEPTRGVDVGARAEIYGIMDTLARDGVAVLMISSDLEEVLGMSDRVLVLHEGRLAGELPRAALSEHAVMRLATGA